jgi:ectoine utilization protein EutC
MPDIVALTERELRQCVSLDLPVVDAIEEAFRALATKRVAMPPILRLDIPDHNGEVDVKTAYVPGLSSFAIKVSPGFFDNPKLGLPSLNGLMILFSARTGLVEALLLDNGYLTDIRTAAAGAVAAQHLAPARVETLGILGAGAQARLQAQAAHLVRNFGRALVWSRDPAKAMACAADLSNALGLRVEAVMDAAAVVRSSELVVTTTPARQPILQAGWLHPGLHITAMGSDAEEKNEIEPAAIARADRFICDRRSQSLRLGELHHAVPCGAVAENFPAVEIGDVIAGKSQGRCTDAEITICDLTGTGVQDTAIATLAFARARARGLGTTIRS